MLIVVFMQMCIRKNRQAYFSYVFDGLGLLFLDDVKAYLLVQFD